MFRFYLYIIFVLFEVINLRQIVVGNYSQVITPILVFKHNNNSFRKYETLSMKLNLRALVMNGRRFSGIWSLLLLMTINLLILLLDVVTLFFNYLINNFVLGLI